jgi:hypothetical protein
MMFSINTVFVATALFTSTQAFSTGAGGCAGGGAAVRGFHLTDTKTIVTGSLADGGVGLYLEGVLLDPTTVANLPANNLKILSLNGTSDYRGLLVRASSAIDVSNALVETSDDLQEAGVCDAPVTGITHNNSNLKNNQAMSIFLVEGNLTLDVTVVFANNATDSIYYYSSYMLNAVAATEAFPECEVCGAGLVISNPDVIVNTPVDGTTPTCAQIQKAGLIGQVDPTICPLLINLLGECGCMSLTAEVATEAIDDPATEAFPECEVCGAGLVISNPDVIVNNPLDGSTPTCAQIQEAGLIGLLDPNLCPLVINLLGGCGCMKLPAEVATEVATEVTDDRDSDTTSPPSSSPTKAPTSGAAEQQQALVASAVSGLVAATFALW